MQLISNKSYAGGYSLHYEVNMWVTNQSIEGNYSDVFWSVDLRGGQAYQISSTAWAKLVINGEQVWSRGSGTFRAGEHKEGIKRIYHNDLGEASCTARLDGKIVQNISTGERSMALANIPRKATFTKTLDLTEDSSEIVFEYSNPAGNYVNKLEFTIHLTGIEESHLPWIDLNKTGYKRAFKFTEEYKEIFRKYIGNKKENQVTYVLKTTIGDKAFYDWSRKNFKLTKTSAPTLTGSLSYINLDKTLPNNNVFNLKNNININLAGKATAKTGTNIKSLNLKIENKTIINSPDNFTFNVGFIKTSGKVRGELVAVDSRGMESNKLITYINVYPYTRPTVFLKAKRKNNFEDETSIDINGKIQSLVIDGKELNAVQVIQYWTSDNVNNKATITSVKVNPDGTFTIPTIWKNYPKTEKKTIYVAIRDKYTFLTADAIELARGQAIFRISTADNKLYNNEKRVLTENDQYFEINKAKETKPKKGYNLYPYIYGYKITTKKTLWSNNTGIDLVNSDKSDKWLTGMPNLNGYISADGKYLIHLFISYGTDGTQVGTICLTNAGPHFVTYIRDFNGFNKDILFLTLGFSNLNSTKWKCKLGGNISIDQNKILENNNVFARYKLKKVIVEKL